MSLVLAIRMIEFIGTFEDDVYDAINSNIDSSGGWDDLDDDDAPMPIGML
jgi:hypothetical protein